MTAPGIATVALVGNPNCGKTVLFNALTGGRQKVANYAGVTVERKEGLASLPSGRQLRILDLPGTYSLRARSPDEAITRDAVLGRLAGEPAPEAWQGGAGDQPHDGNLVAHDDRRDPTVAALRLGGGSALRA